MNMTPGFRHYRQASLRVVIPQGLPVEMQDPVREIISVHSDAPRKGHATALLHQICAEADRHWLTLMIHVEPFDDGAMTGEQLRKWYSRFGFVEIQTEPCLMARSPQKSKIARA